MIWAWLGAAAVGVSLGLLGSGGAILTVPILVYLVGHGEKSAIAESLAIVGGIAVVGVLRAAMQRRIDWTSALLLAVPGIAGTAAGAHVARWIPGSVQLLLLAGLMITAATLMFRKPRHSDADDAPSCAIRPGEHAPARGAAIIGAQGVALGFATGLVGVGGGFLIVPVLALVRRVPMQTAIGTSLTIIMVNSATGLLKYAGDDAITIDWRLVGIFIGLGAAGSLLGNALAGRIYQDTLRRVFAVFLVVMAAYIGWRQAPRAFPQWFGSAPAPVVN
jgi:hypothetical protein